jgi:homocysteine S-methyltransferase
VLDAVILAVRVTGLPVVAYPNSGEQWNSPGRNWQGDGGYDPTLARAWVDAGATYVGGCCRVGPRSIAALTDTINGAGG